MGRFFFAVFILFSVFIGFIRFAGFVIRLGRDGLDSLIGVLLGRRNGPGFPAGIHCGCSGSPGQGLFRLFSWGRPRCRPPGQAGSEDQRSHGCTFHSVPPS